LQPAQVPLHSAQVSLHSAQVSLHPAQVPLHPAQVPLHSAQVPLHSAQVPLHPAQVPLHSAQVRLHFAQVSLHSAENCAMCDGIRVSRKGYVEKEPYDNDSQSQELPTQPRRRVPSERCLVKFDQSLEWRLRTVFYSKLSISRVSVAALKAESARSHRIEYDYRSDPNDSASDSHTVLRVSPCQGRPFGSGVRESGKGVRLEHYRRFGIGYSHQYHAQRYSDIYHLGSPTNANSTLTPLLKS
jgi:hypothetical protein